ncbi:MAG TPA: DNA circularization N-terminal domain-containing protein [Nakamurella multipartita]|nr:DNA circularization N-terminal domain-containing protein [Nakamurella multipartita]
MRYASYKGVRFDWTEMSRSVQHENQVHKFPNKTDKDGNVVAIRKPQVDNTTTGPRQFDGTAVFTGNDADVRASEFWDAVEAGGPGTFVHPIYGEMQAVAETGTERRSGGDSKYVSIEVKFTEDGRADIGVREVPAATVARKARIARKTITDRATLAMAPCLTSVQKAAAAVEAAGTCIDDVTGAMRAVMSPSTFQPLFASTRSLMGSLDALVLAPLELAAQWVSAVQVLIPSDLWAATRAEAASIVDRTEVVEAGVQDLVRDSTAIAAAEASVADPGASSKSALDLAREAAEGLRACALLAATPEVHAALMDLAGATVQALQDASGALPQTRLVPVPAAVSPILLAGELYPDDPEGGALALLASPGATGLFVPVGTVEVAGG